MSTLPSEFSASRSGRDAWRPDNERGLALAAEGDWEEASEAFAASADCLARMQPAEMRSVHEPLALVLSNLSQAQFRRGRRDDAMQHAQRGLALRIAIGGEDALPVARARMDLAVMLATAGQFAEATTLMDRAIAVFEHRVGDDDVRLADVLENAARIALAGGHPANAEPLLLRLHALLDAHGLSTGPAERLLAMVAEARTRMGGPVSASPSVTATTADASAFDDWEDEPLRDAVAMTDALLRTASVASPPPVPSPIAPGLDSLLALGDIETVPTHADLTADDRPVELTPIGLDAPFEVLGEPSPTASPSALPDASTSMFALELSGEAPELPMPTREASLVDLDLDLAFDDAPASPEAAARRIDETDTPALLSDTSGMRLDFDVDHGLGLDDEPGLVPPPELTLPVPQALEPPSLEALSPEFGAGELPEFAAGDAPSFEPPSPPPRVEPVTPIISSGPTTGIRAIDGIVPTSAPDAAPPPPPIRPRSEPAASKPPASMPAKATSITQTKPSGAARRPAGQRPTPRKSAKSNNKGLLVLVLLIAVAAVGGALAYFVLR